TDARKATECQPLSIRGDNGQIVAERIRRRGCQRLLIALPHRYLRQRWRIDGGVYPDQRFRVRSPFRGREGAMARQLWNLRNLALDTAEGRDHIVTALSLGR